MHSAAGNAAPLSRAELRRVIAAIVIGNGFVAYDFTVYSFAAVAIGNLFFPSANPASSFLLSLATFGAGFAMRPLGAILIGHIADSRGRKAGLTVSLTLMTLGTWLIACLPGYAAIGPIATVLMVLARLMQGLAAGGEIGPASASLMESAGYRHRCFMVSWRGASQGAAAFVAALVGAATTALLSPAAMHAWGWRVPFVLGGLIGPVGWYLRRHMPAAAPQRRTRLSPRRMFAEHTRPLVCGILMMAAPSVSIYLTVFYMPAYLVRTLHRPLAISLLTACLSGIVILVVTPLVAYAADRLASRKTLQYATLVASLVTAWPVFWALTHGAGDLAALVIITAYVALAVNNAGANSVLMLEAFPAERRAAGMSVIYSFGVVLFGGFSPFLVTWLINRTGDPMVPAWYLIGATLLTLCALKGFPEKTSAGAHITCGSQPPA
ncbi:MFS transporter [Paraburkholderia ginsengiterrae]|uniref:MFS transporter n=1 Tax=Paraburkholderia ginsengiterrae TaxID=1462993 RepID=A0A1A9N4U7_9BURK|nr:MFS transporter [Paraburkholderia ginsengiterrae]OAJ53221.1 MFS transporter [Paraburkholderia ginsengiterrae]OAJ56684.1 MFS transporter [Paraburkholderia ginsengiterrae]